MNSFELERFRVGNIPVVYYIPDYISKEEEEKLQIKVSFAFHLAIRMIV